MKKIVLLTDFAKRNKRAEHIAISLCHQLNLDLLLLHNYVALPIVPLAGGAPLMALPSQYDQAQDDMAKRLRSIRHRIGARFGKGFQPKVKCMVTEGEIGQVVSHLIPREDIELVVMGACSGGNFAHMLLGNVARSVTKKATCPVLLVPSTQSVKMIKRIVFATNLMQEDFNALAYLARMSAFLGCSVELVHICNSFAPSKQELKAEQALIKKLEDHSHLNIRYSRIIGAPVLQKLHEVCKQRKANILALSDHQRGLLKELFGKDTITEALHGQSVPMLVFPTMMQPANYFLKGPNPLLP